MLENLGKTIIIMGLALAAIGALLVLLNKVPGFGRLPGDIMIKKENYSFYFPVTTSILLSLLLSFILYLFSRK